VKQDELDGDSEFITTIELKGKLTSYWNTDRWESWIWKGVCKAYINPILKSNVGQTHSQNRGKTWKAHIVFTLFLPQDVIESLDVGITTTRVETFVAPTMDVVRRGVLTRSTTKMGCGLDGVLASRKLNGKQHYQHQLLELLRHLRSCLPIQ
jgi:hypothetical protein